MNCNQTMTDKLVTIAAFSRAIEADVARTKLESEGIPCVLADEHTVTVNWLYSRAVGGVKLKVRESDARRAIETLGQEPQEEKPTETGEPHFIDEPRCPRCNSSNVYYEKVSRRAFFLSWLFLGFPIPFIKRSWKCQGCGYEWKEK